MGFYLFLFSQKTAYEMRISDWSSDVCSSDLGAYRRFERRALERITADPAPKVIATGGSLPSEPATYAHLLSHCFTVWLKARPEEHMGRVVAQGDMRPMAGQSEAMADLKRILAQREALHARADKIGRAPCRARVRHAVEV